MQSMALQRCMCALFKFKISKRDKDKRNHQQQQHERQHFTLFQRTRHSVTGILHNTQKVKVAAIAVVALLYFVGNK